MQRTQIYLDESQAKLLHQMAKMRAKSLSELIREAIWKFIGRELPLKGRSALDGIVGLYHRDADKTGSTDHDDIYE